MVMKPSSSSSKQLSAEMCICIPVEKGSKKYVTVIALFNTSTSKSLLDKKQVNEKVFDVSSTTKTVWETEAGNFTTSEEVNIKEVRLHQFTTKRQVEFGCSVFKKSCGYDTILGHNFGQVLGINVINKSKTFERDNVEIPMVPQGH